MKYFFVETNQGFKKDLPDNLPDKHLWKGRYHLVTRK